MENSNLESVYPNLDNIKRSKDQKIKNFKFLFFTKKYSKLGSKTRVQKYTFQKMYPKTGYMGCIVSKWCTKWGTNLDFGIK